MPDSHAELQVESWLTLLYEDLHARAQGYLQGEAKHVSIRPTDLLHDAYVRIAQSDLDALVDQTHLLALASRAMRRVLVDAARARKAKKRGGDWERLNIEDVHELSTAPTVDILEIDEALSRLAEVDRRDARIVEMKVFGGLTNAEIAMELGISDTYSRRIWRHARAWLALNLGQDHRLSSHP